MKENHNYRYRHLVRMGELIAITIEVDEEVIAMADTMIEKYIREHIVEDTSSTMEIWKVERAGENGSGGGCFGGCDKQI